VIGEPPEPLRMLLERGVLVRLVHHGLQLFDVEVALLDLRRDVFGAVGDEERLADAASVHRLDDGFDGGVLRDVDGDAVFALERRVEEVEVSVDDAELRFHFPAHGPGRQRRGGGGGKEGPAVHPAIFSIARVKCNRLHQPNPRDVPETDAWAGVG
jgi:hypothetical protein